MTEPVTQTAEDTPQGEEVYIKPITKGVQTLFPVTPVVTANHRFDLLRGNGFLAPLIVAAAQIGAAFRANDPVEYITVIFPAV